jgi:copper transport protein
MPRSTTHRLLLFALVLGGVLATVLGVSTGSVLAHNSLVSSDPADGSTLAVAPTQIVWVFDKSVPLDTLTVTLIDASGARNELAGSVHGAAGDAEVVTPLPVLQPGDVSIRWRLVGPDGHPVTGRVDVTITPPAVSVAPEATPTTPAGADAAPSTAIPPAVGTTADDGGDGASSTPSLVRWLLRYSSYLAIMAVVGILLTSAYVWSGAGTHPLLRQILSGALIATAVLAFLQLLVIGSDISGDTLWATLGAIDAALSTDAGMALAVRIVIAIAMWLVLFQYRIDHPDVYWTAVSLPSLALLATWAFAGHSSSMRWPEIGVITDVAHHAAAAAWIAGLAIVGWIVIPTTTPDVLGPAVRRFSRVAAVSVGILVVTGLVQTVRLVGSPTDLLDADHGRYLVAKLVVLAVMLAIANINRRRIDNHLDDTTTIEQHLGPIRNAVIAEFAIGLAIVAITAAMVVSPPSTSETTATALTSLPTDIYYIL